MEQLTIFAEYDKGAAIMRKAYEFRNEHPKVYAEFVDTAREMARHQRKFGIQFIAEVYRWEHRIDPTDVDYKINNTTLAGLSRLMVRDAPEIEPYLTMRESACDSYLEMVG